MKTQITFVEMHAANIRAGMICLTALVTYFLWVTGISDLPRAFTFMAAFAVCLVLTLKSVVDAATWIFGFAARYSGMGLGHLFRLSQQLVLRLRSRSR
jgi:hypothetical protein